MYDREKVINDLQDAVNDDWIWQHADYYALTMERAIALLKEQEAKPVELHTNAYGTKFYFCPKCKRELFHTRNRKYRGVTIQCRQRNKHFSALMGR